jgi:hypothetical protein
MRSGTPVVTPSGERTSARDWAAGLGLFYSPSILIFDEGGRELVRVDSVVGFYRLASVLAYIESKAYLTETYQQWRISRELEARPPQAEPSAGAGSRVGEERQGFGVDAEDPAGEPQS